MAKLECHRTAADEQICVTYGGHHIKVYREGRPHKFGYELLCCAVIWALPTRMKFTADS
jgi:hypothetical protein